MNASEISDDTAEPTLQVAFDGRGTMDRREDRLLGEIFREVGIADDRDGDTTDERQMFDELMGGRRSTFGGSGVAAIEAHRLLSRNRVGR